MGLLFQHRKRNRCQILFVLDGMPGQDAKGMTNLRDKVDNYYGRLFGIGAL